MKVTKTGQIPPEKLVYFSTWGHFIGGFTALVFGLIFIIIALKKYGLAHFYPYLFGDLLQIKSDINSLIKLQLPEPQPRGLATSVQGLGLGALLLAVVSGGVWFVLWQQEANSQSVAREVHKTLVGLIEAYLVGHGALGILHMFVTFRKRSTHAPK